MSRRKVERADLLGESELMVDALCDDIKALMSGYNQALVDLQQALRESQPREHGAILLELNRCGYGCLGCPHPIWQKWISKPSSRALSGRAWVATRMKRPLAAATAMGRPEATLKLIVEAQKVVEKRTRLLEHLKRVNQSIAHTRNAASVSNDG